jgi:hypothetical protein
VVFTGLLAFLGAFLVTAFFADFFSCDLGAAGAAYLETSGVWGFAGAATTFLWATFLTPLARKIILQKKITFLDFGCGFSSDFTFGHLSVFGFLLIFLFFYFHFKRLISNFLKIFNFIG